MPQIEVRLTIHAPLEEVWSAVKDVQTYPTYMRNVQEVTVLPDGDGETGEDGARMSAWRVWLKGSVLEWIEREVIDEVDHTVAFEQVEGDLDVFTGHWRVEEAMPGEVEVELIVSFEIGIPLLADMLNPVAATALRDNSEEMLREIERRVGVA
jgi:ribosome-associated toxin RatA of RatAB toxin-antitoxin module